MQTFHGPNPYSTSPVVVVHLRSDELQGIDAGRVRERLNSSFAGWLDDCPPAEFIDPAHAAAQVAAYWARALLNSVRGAIEAAGATAPAPRRLVLWVGFHVPELTTRAIRLALDLMLVANSDKANILDAALRQRVLKLQTLCRRHHPNELARILLLAARADGLPAQPSAAMEGLWQFGWGQRSQVFFEVAPSSESFLGHRLAGDKRLTHQLLRRLGFPTTQQAQAETLDSAREIAARLGWPLVVKPADRGKGHGVTVGVDSDAGLAEAFAEAQRYSTAPPIIERVVQGFDHRLLVVRGTLVAASRREPPSVCGDGQRSIGQLIAALNAQRAADPVLARFLKQIGDDPMVARHLAALGLGRDSVLEPGRVVYLRGNANVSTGGTPTDVLAQVHPQVRAMAQAIAVNLGLESVGIDYLASDIARPCHEVGGAVIEVNRTPGLDVHIADGAFTPEAIGRIVLGPNIGRIPVVVVVADAPSQRALLRALEARRESLVAGTALLGPDETATGAWSMAREGLPVYRRVQQAVAQVQIPALLIAIDADEIATRGFPVDRCALALWHGNVSSPAADQAIEISTRCADTLVSCDAAQDWPSREVVDRVVAALTAGADGCARPTLRAGRRRHELATLKAHSMSAGPALFAMLRDEIYLVPHFFNHYRALGVENFLVYDDHSSDGTTEFLLAQPDCTVLRADCAYNDQAPNGQPFHHYLKNAVPNSLATERWVLVVDADEFLQLPRPFKRLADLYAYLDARQYTCVLASMVDFYPRRLRDRGHSASLSPFQGSPYFDAERSFVRDRATGRISKVFGGIRPRLQKWLEARDPAQYEAIYKDRGYRMAALWKTPLIKTGAGVYLKNAHSVNVVPPLDIELALAHFKFGPDLDAKIAYGLALRRHYLGSIEYRFLDAVCQRFDDDELLSESSRSYSGALSLEEAGFTFCAAWP